MRKIRQAAVAAAVALLTAGCTHIDDDRIPPSPVRIAFNTVGEWNIYGVGGAGDYRYFIKQDRIPDGYPYTVATYTGFGGVLLICDIHNNPVAYDLACPVECRADVRIRVVKEDLKAECPVCHSIYDIVTNHGQPLSGPAAEKHYGLRKYYVGPGSAGEYMLVFR